MPDELLLQLRELVVAIMENRGSQSGVGVAGTEHLYEIGGSARAPRRNHRDSHCVRYRTGQFAIEAAAGSVAVHRRKEDFTCAAGLRFPCPLDRISARGRSSAAGECFPALSSFRAFGVDSHNHRLRSETLCNTSDQRWVG